MSEIKYPIGGYAPGDYMSSCSNCKNDFIGAKLSTQCEPCAINAINKSNTIAIAELLKIKRALKNITFSNDLINDI